MNTIYLIGGTTAIFMLNMLAMRGLGWAMTEYRRPLINLKPLNCRPCLTFWLTSTGGAVAGLFLVRYFPQNEIDSVRYIYNTGMCAIAVLTGFINFLYVKSKTIIYE